MFEDFLGSLKGKEVSISVDGVEITKADSVIISKQFDTSQEYLALFSIDNLLDQFNRYKVLYEESKDERYKAQMEHIKIALKLKVAEK
jgi:hypothetical protein